MEYAKIHHSPAKLINALILEIVEIINQQLGLISISRHASKRNFKSHMIANPNGSKIEALKGLVAMHYIA